jgi:hypothetical protein
MRGTPNSGLVLLIAAVVLVSWACPATAGYVTTVMDDGPIGYWHLGEAAGPESLGVVLAVDFNDRGAAEAIDPTVTQPGFSEFLIDGIENDDQVNPTTRTFGGIDVTVVHSNGLGIGDRRRTHPLPGASYSYSELQRDVLFARTTGGGATTDDGLDILIENLDPLTAYEVEIWSYDDGSNSPRRSDWFANGELAIDDYTFDGSDTNPPQSLASDDAAMFSLLTTSGADGTILIEGRQAYAGSEIGVYLNGLRVTQVVPEPSTLVLLTLGTIALVPVSRRQRRESNPRPARFVEAPQSDASRPPVATP